MKRTAIISSTILFLIFIFYTSIWYVLSNQIATAVLNLSTLPAHPAFKGQKIIVEGVSVSGFPFKFGAKASSIKEETKDGVIDHKGALYIGYDLLNQKLYSCYDGIIDSKANLLNSGDKNLIVECKSEIYAKIKLSFSLVKLLLQKDKSFELVNFIKTIENSTIIKAYNTDDKSLLLDQIIKVKIDTDNQNYYHNMEEILADDSKHKYFITSSVLMNKNNMKGYNLPNSIFYSSLQTLSFNSLDFDGVIDISFKNMINDFEFQINALKYDANSYSGQMSCYTKVHMDQGNIDIDFKLKDSANPKDGFYDYLNKNLFVVGISRIISMGMNPVIAVIINEISANPEKYYFPKKDLKSIETKLDIAFLYNNDTVNVDIKQLDIFFDDTGIRIADKVVMDSKLAFATNGLLSIKRSNNMLEYWSSYLLQHLPENKDRISLVSKTLGQFLRSISNHPESNNDEMFFDFSADSVTKDVKIGDKKSDELLSIYKQYLYQNALEIASNDPDFIKKAPLIIPDLIEDKAIMQKLQNASSKAQQVLKPDVTAPQNPSESVKNITPTDSAK